MPLSPRGLASFHHFLSGPWHMVDGCLDGGFGRPPGARRASAAAPDADDVRSLLRLTTTRQPAGLWRHRSRVSRIRSGTYGARSVHTHAPREPVAGGVATRPRRERRRPPHPSPDAAGLSVPAFHDVRVRGYRYSEVRLCYLEMGVTVHVQVVAVVAGGGRCGWEPRPVILRYMRGPSAHLVCSFDLKLPCKLTYLLHHIF